MSGEANKIWKSVVCAGIVILALAGMEEARGNIADLDCDGNVNFSDYAILAEAYKTGSLDGDINGDEKVDYKDLKKLAENWLCGKKANGKIAFVSSRDGNREIYVMDANGSNQEGLTYDERRDNYPAWSPDGRKLAYVSGGGKEISIIDLETGIQTVIFSPNHWLATPAWSPNGEKIAFCYNEFGGGIFTINSNGTNQTYLADGWCPDWSPDGEKITYSGLGQSGDIYVMNADGSEQINLTNHPAFDSESSWSPDGMKIAFTSERELTGEIYLMNTDGTEQIRLTYNDWPDRSSSARDASWSPDGNYIAFARGREVGIPEEDITPWLPEIYIINICNKNLTRLTNNDFVNKQPAWCPIENVTELNVLTSYSGASKTR
jgi:Tol biopolymer transport system component